MASRTAFSVLAVTSLVFMVSAAKLPPSKVAAKEPKKVCDVCACTGKNEALEFRMIFEVGGSHEW